jgi:hypothetical protein
MKLTAIPNGRLGNGIFRYMAVLLFMFEYGEPVAPPTPPTETIDFKELKYHLYEPKGYITEDDFKKWCDKYPKFPPIDRKLLLLFNDYYQRDIYKHYAARIREYMRAHPNDIIYSHKKETTEQYTVRQLIETPAPRGGIVIHVRLEDFFREKMVIHPQSLCAVITEITRDYPDEPICIISNKLTQQLEAIYMSYIKSHFPQITIEHNDVITDYHIMCGARVLVCSLSTLSWCAALLSECVEKVYMPRQRKNANQTFMYPIENTVLYENINCGRQELIEFFCSAAAAVPPPSAPPTTV